jgi:Tfp pilus assembly protein PilO
MLSPSSLARLSLLERLLIWVLGVVLAAIVGYAAFYVPARRELARATNELRAAEAQRAQAVQQLAGQRGLAATLARDEQALADAAALLPGAAGPPEDLLFVLPELARQTGVQVERWRPEPDEPVGAWGMRRPVRVEARASWADVAEFLRRAGELRETIRVDVLAIDLEPGAALLEISLRVSVVWVRPDLDELVARGHTPVARL